MSFMMQLPMDGSIDLSNDTFKWNSNPTIAQIQQGQQSSEIRADGTFPVKLHNMLQKVQGTIFQELIDWDPDGMSFVIYKPKEFADQLMGMYFKQTKYKSFQRQLNFYGFTRSRRGIIRGVYTHPLFQRDKPDLCHRMRRMDANGNTNDSSFEASSSMLGQQNSSAAMLQHRISLSPNPSSNSINQQQQQHQSFGLLVGEYSHQQQQQQQQTLMMNMPNDLSSQIRRPQQQQHHDHDSMGTIDDLPLDGYSPGFLAEGDDPF